MNCNGNWSDNAMCDEVILFIAVYDFLINCYLYIIKR